MRRRKLLLTAVLLSAAPMFAAEPTTTAANAINALGVDLLRQSVKPGANALLSPYSIQNALAMTYAGADGDTRTEMLRVLHYPDDDAEVHRSFAALRKSLEDVIQKSVREAEQMQKWGGRIDPITLTMANRLFGQTGYAFREPFLKLVKDDYDALLELLDFAKNPPGTTKHINAWVEDQTRHRIRDLIPAGALNDITRLVLVNAIYLKAPWADEFSESRHQATNLLPRREQSHQCAHDDGPALLGLRPAQGHHRSGNSVPGGRSAISYSAAGQSGRVWPTWKRS